MDARRNRDRLLDVARAAFTGGRTLSIEALAREAGVGVGTVYRNFPGREALIEAVYGAERAELCARVESLLSECEPVTALRRWLGHYVDFVAAKRGAAAPHLAAGVAASAPVGESREVLVAAVATLLDAGARVGTLRADARADDVVATLVGISLVTEERAQLERQLELLVDGLRHGAPATESSDGKPV